MSGVWRDLWGLGRFRLEHLDRPAWRRFWLALLGLGLAFFLALYSTALHEAGYAAGAAAVAAVALLIAAFVAVKVVPYLARRTAFERWWAKIDYEFTHEGLVYFLIIMVIAIAGLNTGNNLLFIILASLLAAILVSGILSAIVLAELEMDFVLPEHLFAGQPVVARLAVENRKWVFPSFSITLAARRRDGASRKGAVAANRPILDAPVYLPHIPHRASVTQHVELVFPRRGRYAQEGFRASTKFPFGLLRKAREVASRQEVLVLPAVRPMAELSNVLPLLGGEMESFAKGRGHDLYSIRDYRESDTARHVDWKATAKAQQLKVREFTREDERRLALVFDAAVHTLDERRLAQFEKGVSFCASLAWHFASTDTQIQFITHAFETPMAPAAEVLYPILEHLALVEPLRGELNPPSALEARLANAAHPAAFHIIVTSRPRGSIPTSLWGASYMVFAESL